MTYTKNCCRCGHEKSFSDFYKDPRKPGKFTAACKPCIRSRSKTYDKTRRREYDKIRSHLPHRRELMKQVRQRRLQDPLKSGAENAVNYAVRSGKLPRANQLVCVDCSNRTAVDWHHESYEREHWLNVVPLCRICHAARHAS